MHLNAFQSWSSVVTAIEKYLGFFNENLNFP